MDFFFYPSLLSLLAPTPFVRGRPDPTAISKTVVLVNLKFCRVLETSLNVLEMLTLFRLGSHCPPLFLIYLWSNYRQTWHDRTLGQNLLKAKKVLLASLAGGKYDIIEPFLVSFQVKFEFTYLLSNGAENWHRGQF